MKTRFQNAPSQPAPVHSWTGGAPVGRAWALRRPVCVSRIPVDAMPSCGSVGDHLIVPFTSEEQAP